MAQYSNSHNLSILYCIFKKRNPKQQKMESSTKILVTVVLAGASLFAGGITLHLLCKYLRSNDKSLRRRRPNLEIHVISTSEELAVHLEKFKEHLKVLKVIGFDCEWTFDPSLHQRHPVALLQMATPFGLCLLVRLCHIRNNVPQTLRDILMDQSILKVGVAVGADGKKLQKDYGIAVLGCVDLRHLLTRVRNSYKCDYSLQGLAGGILGVTLDKRHEIRCSDWEADILSPEQVDYAAADGQVGVDIFTKLVLTKLTNGDSGDLVWTLTGVNLQQLWRLTKSITQGIVDVGYRESRASNNKTHHVKHPNKKAEEAGRAYSARARPLYHNCQLQAPDGQPLCTCDVRKAEWYIEKGLGDKVADHPLTVRLRFEPSGRPESERNYYLQEKENVCVVCGRSDTYTRKFVVPQEYRKYFPTLLKDHRSHDILLLCPPCHQVSSNHDVVLRQILSEECDAPIDTGLGCRSVQDEERMKTRSAAKALKLSRSKIPEARVKELEQVILDYFNLTSLTDDILDTCIAMDTRIFNSEYMPHGKKVVIHFSQRGTLWEFERRWRQHFVKTMNPQYLPPLWSVDHHHNGVLSTH